MIRLFCDTCEKEITFAYHELLLDKHVIYGKKNQFATKPDGDSIIMCEECKDLLRTFLRAKDDSFLLS